VIVLEKEGIARAREFDQIRAARETHRHTQRKLMLALRKSAWATAVLKGA
jgi:hypothetical protein